MQVDNFSISWRLLTLAVAVCLSHESAKSPNSALAFIVPGSTLAPEPPVQADYLRPGLSAADVLRARGYLAEEFFFYTRDGYKINIVRGRNPLINGGASGQVGTLPILFVHGIISAAPTFLASADPFDLAPRNFSWLLGELAKIRRPEKLIELLGDDSSTKNLPILALNFGYEIWLLNKRGFNKSKGRRGYENRTLSEAIASIPSTFLSNGIYPDWLSQSLPHFKADEKPEIGREITCQTTTPSPSEHKSHWSLWRELILKGITLENLPKALKDFGHFREQFIQTFDPDYWNFSMDEHVEHEIPDALDFISERSNCSRVHTVGLSSGGALILMAAAARPPLASKIASAILWAPSLNMGSAQDLINELSQLLPITQSYSGPIPFVFNQQQLTGLLQELCSKEKVQRTACSRLFDVLFGFSQRQAPLTPAILATILEPTSYHELAHLGQFAHTTRPCKFKFNEPKKNLERYGQLEPPCYDLSRVELEHISIYGGNEDWLITPGDHNTTRSQLGVPIKLNIIDEPGIYFNHAGSITHEQANRLVLVPSLLDIRRAETSRNLLKAAAECHAN